MSPRCTGSASRGETLRRDITKLVIRVVGDQAKMACGSLQLCAGLEDGVEGSTHAVAHRRQERTALVPFPEGGTEKDSVDERTAAAGEAASVGEANSVVCVGEVLSPPGRQQKPEEGEGGANNDLSTAVEGIEVGEDDMYKGEVAEAEGDNAEAEEEGLGGLHHR